MGKKKGKGREREGGGHGREVDTIKLLCWILGTDSDRVFYVQIPERVSVDDLKNAIKKQIEPDLDRVAAHNLDIGKLPISISIDQVSTLREAETLDDAGAEKLSPVQTLQDVFPDHSASDKVEIVVQVPPDSQSHKRRRIDSPLFQPAPKSMASIREFYWGKPTTNFMTEVEVIRDTNPIADVELPGTIRSLSSPNFSGTDEVNRIMVREEYDAIEEWLSANGAYGISLVCGHPGIGKSLFLHVLLAKRLSKKKTTIWHPTPERLYLFDADGAYEINPDGLFDDEANKKIPRGTSILVDAGSAFNKPAPFLLECKTAFRFILASSPRQAHWVDWEKEAGDLRRFLVEPWSLSEIIAARSFQIPSGGPIPTEEQLREFYTKFGPSARDAYRKATNLPAYENRLQDYILKLTPEMLTSALEKTSFLDLHDTVSHKLFLVKPDPEDRESIIVGPVTPYVQSLLVGQMKKYRIVALLNEYEKFTLMKGTKSLAGEILESMAHKIFSSGQTFEVFKASHFHRSVNTNYEINSEAESLNLSFSSRIDSVFQGADFDGILTGDLNPNFYYRPQSPNQPLLDSFIFDTNPDMITLFQITRQLRHTMNDGYLKRVAAAVAQRNTKNKKNTKWRYILAFPDDGPKRRCYHTKTEDEWTADVYMLPFDPEMLAR